MLKRMSTDTIAQTPFAKPDHCELCGRRMAALTKHHLIPRTRHKNRRNKRRFTRDEVKSRILWVCRPCHNHIHDVFSDKDLERQYNTLDALLSHPDIQRFRHWIASRPTDYKPRSRGMKRG